VPQQYHRVEVKILTHLLQICDVGCECDVFGLNMIGGSATPTLVVVDETERIGEAVQFGHAQSSSRSEPSPSSTP
jgi:hypothetical protein